MCVGADFDLEECNDEATSISMDGNFLDDVIRVLLNARRVLSASYCIGYFLPPDSHDLIQGHETLQVLIFNGLCVFFKQCKAGCMHCMIPCHCGVLC